MVMGPRSSKANDGARDLVVCRVNMALVPIAYDLIKRGIKAIVRGARFRPRANHC